MAYTALYRKFRPGEFDDVKGQETIVTTLKNQIKSERMGHAYLFCGTRGTGKTTVAKILAKAVNCEHPVDGSPCGECSMCKAITAQNSMNVIEIDAASNNGVDNIREIIDEVQYSPTEGKYKVYIIDEVHMLSAGAFNALLKTLEEPPAYVIFILATTEVHKIPITILSRCQRYDFKRITIDTIVARLSELMEKEKLQVEEKALRYIAKAADGSLRDALSLLDRCIAFYFGEKLTYDQVLEVLGAVDTEVFRRLFHNVQQEKVIECMEQLEELVTQGRELTQFTVDFTWYFRNLLLLKTSQQGADIIDVPSDQIDRLREDAELVDVDTLIRYIRIFSDLANQIKYASQKRVVLEIALIKLCRPQMETNYDSLIQRISKLEEQLEKGVFTVKPQTAVIPQTSGKEKSIEESKSEAEPVYDKAIPEDLKQVAQNWNAIKSELPALLRAMVSNAIPSFGSENELLLIFDDKTEKEYIDTPENVTLIHDIVCRKVQKEIKVRVKQANQNKESDRNYPNLTKLVKMPIEYVD